MRNSYENCGNVRCANSLIAVCWDECVESGFTKHWKPKETDRATLIERGYTARGGEYHLLVIPFIYYTGKRITEDWIKDFREMRRGGQ